MATAKKPFPKVIVESFPQVLDLAEKLAGGRPEMEASREAKKNYAEYFSRGLATWVANGLRPRFKGILPTRDGKQQESRARSAKGVKKLDVNFSTIQLGLGLGVSIKLGLPRAGKQTGKQIGFKGAMCPSPLPPVCPPRCPARRPSTERGPQPFGQ